MKVLVLYDYPPSPGGLATQGQLLHKGLEEMGVEVFSVNFESAQEKEWYYRWFEPDVVEGLVIGDILRIWFYTPNGMGLLQSPGLSPTAIWRTTRKYLRICHSFW